MSENLIGILWTAAGAAVVALIGTIGTIIVRAQRGRASEPELWEELRRLQVTVYGGRDAETGREVVGMTERLNAADRRSAAQARIIRALSRQWPEGSVPRLDPADIMELEEDTIPAHWKVKPL